MPTGLIQGGAQPLAHTVRIDGEAAQDLACRALDIENAEEDVPHLDVLAPLSQGQPAGALEGQVGSIGEGQVRRRCPRPLAGYRLRDLHPAALEGRAAGRQGGGRAGVGLGQDPEEQVLGADLIVVQLPGGLIGPLHGGPSRPVEPFDDHHAW